MSGKRVQKIALAAVAVLATFGIGFFVGREFIRPPAASPRDPALRYDLTPYAAVSPQLLGYRLRLKVPIDLRQPRGIACRQDGTIYICGDRELLAVDRKGAIMARYALEGEPTCVAAGTDGRIYLGLQDHVEVIVPGGGTIEWPDLGPQAMVTSIAAAGTAVFVADAGNRMVLRFDTGGKLVGRIAGGFVVPSPYFDLAAAADGTLFVANPGVQRVQRYSPEGKLLGTWGRYSLEADGFPGCCNPVHLALLPCGSVVTGEKGLLRVKVYEPDGRLTAVVATPADFPPGEASLDLATRKANGGEILVLVPGERAVRIYCKKEVAGDG
jgi:DNA-binding beta-propeller fold protein YncE